MGTTVNFARPDGQEGSGYLASGGGDGAAGIVLIQE